MSIRFYQPGDYDNTILRKQLENDAATLGGSGERIHLRVDGHAGTPRFYQPGDVDNTILRKLLENQSGVIAGRLRFHFS